MFDGLSFGIHRRVVTRLIDLSVVGNRSIGGPVRLLDGERICSAELVANDTVALGTAVVQIKSGIAENRLYSFDTPANLTSAAPYIRHIGHSTFGVAGELFLDAEVTTAQAGATGRLSLLIAKDPSGD